MGNANKLLWIFIDLSFCLSIIFEDEKNIITLKIIALLNFFLLKIYMHCLNK